MLSTLPYWPFICLIFWLQETVSFPHAYARNSTHIRHQSDRIIFSCSSPTDWERGQGDLKGKNRKQDKQTKRAKKCSGTLHAKASSSAGGVAGTWQITRHQKRQGPHQPALVCMLAGSRHPAYKGVSGPCSSDTPAEAKGMIFSPAGGTVPPGGRC